VSSGLGLNRLLGSLSPSDLARLESALEPYELKSEAVIYEPNEPITHLYFPLSGTISLIVVGDDGTGVEAATIGNEGVAGLGGLLARDVSFTRQVVQLGGQALRIARSPFLAAANDSSRLRGQLAAHSDAFTAHLIQSAACNARHDVEQRLARWLLTTTDRSHQNSIPVTHGELAVMLAVTRPTVTLAARMMQQAGLIDYKRGTVSVTDRPGLEALACECYRIVNAAYDQALGGGGS
jgi:CRP-like cAMP-binding protein